MKNLKVNDKRHWDVPSQRGQRKKVQIHLYGKKEVHTKCWAGMNPKWRVASNKGHGLRRSQHPVRNALAVDYYAPIGICSTGRVKISLRLNTKCQRVISNAICLLDFSTLLRATGVPQWDLGPFCALYIHHVLGCRWQAQGFLSKDGEQEYMEKGNSQFPKIIC